MRKKFYIVLATLLAVVAWGAAAQTDQPAPQASLTDPTASTQTAVEENRIEQQSVPDVEEEGINVQQIIFSHLLDSYEWHITGWNGHEIAIALPCIVRSSESGWHCFSSHHLFAEGEYEGFYVGAKGSKWEDKIVARNSAGEEYRPLDLSITKNALGVMINSLLMIVIFVSVAGWYRRNGERKAPKGFVGTMEMLVMSIEDDVIHKSIGDDYRRYSPYLLTAFFFIFINNLMGLIPIFPGGANTTGNIAVTLVLALCTMVAINVFGNKHYWRDILWPDVPWWMKVPIPLMPIIELFGVISKPFALTIRLFANILAGHTIILALVCMVFITFKVGIGIGAGMTIFSVVLSIFMLCLEMLVAFIQAYVFTMLSAVFIGMSRQKETAKETK